MHLGYEASRHTLTALAEASQSLNVITKLQCRTKGLCTRNTTSATCPVKAVVVEFDVRWIAGFVDGEGCIGVYPKNKFKDTRYYVLIVQVAQSGCVGKRITDYFKDKYGGTVYKQTPKNPSHKVQWKWSVCSDMAAAFLKDVEDYLYVKKEEAALALQFQALACKRSDDPEATSLASRLRQAKVDI